MRLHEITGGKAKKAMVQLVLNDSDRSRLAQHFPPKFPEFIGHHITYAVGVPTDSDLPETQTIHVVGYACDEAGIEALVVEVDGTTRRPDGRTFHVTWSLDRDAGFKPVKSNELIANHGFTRLASPINIDAKPKFF